ncbi:MAG: mechanosensitive ion channel family protein [Spirochaetaceae bacterium]|nr:mechanosensitive ion channel family protein [Spirochaetaceae bacterium]
MEKLKSLLVENTGPQWAEMLLFIAAGIVSALFFSTVIFNLIQNFTKRTKTVIDDTIIAHIRAPISLVLVLGGAALGINNLTISAEAAYWKNKIIFAAFVCIASWMMMKILDSIIAHHVPREIADAEKNGSAGNGEDSIKVLQTDFKPVFRRLVNIVMVILPFAIVAKAFGYDISAILAGLGIGGAALALAARDILASFFGSLAVLADKPFRVGDRIRFIDKAYEAIDGVIVEIRFRTTRLRTFDNRILCIPNSIFSAQPVQNVSSEPHTRIVQIIPIRASNGYEKTQAALEILRTLAPKDVQFGTDHIAALTYTGIAVYKITFIFFIAKDADYFGTINAVNMEIVRCFEKTGIEF